MGGVTKRAKIAADHRDAVADVEAIADRPSTGARRARGKRRPWVVEYRAEKNHERVSFFYKHDGEWHQYGNGYENQRGAESAMRTLRLQNESFGKLSNTAFHRAIEWRVRNTEEGAEK
jgi:hypothetical protein